jgi:hypothetical protein
VLAGNTADCTTLRGILGKIEAQYGKAHRIWVMDRGIPTEEVLAEMRQADPPISYLVGTPKGRLSKLEKALLTLPWQAVREGVEVKLLPHEQELYVLAKSRARIHKERAMRRRKLKWLWARLQQISAMNLEREELLMKLGAARAKARAAPCLKKARRTAAVERRRIYRSNGAKLDQRPDFDRSLSTRFPFHPLTNADTGAAHHSHRRTRRRRRNPDCHSGGPDVMPPFISVFWTFAASESVHLPLPGYPQ